jgi:hypothetical protein
MKIAKYLRWSRVFIVLGAVLIAIQLVPYGRWHVNPPVVAEPRWDSPQTRALAQRACFDCHSNETEWPFYARVAPASWLVQYDVMKGRAELNFSEWQRPQKEAREAPEVLREREMPPLPYRLVHGHARLTPAERELLAAGLSRSLGVRPHEETARR